MRSSLQPSSASCDAGTAISDNPVINRREVLRKFKASATARDGLQVAGKDL